MVSGPHRQQNSGDTRWVTWLCAAACRLLPPRFPPDCPRSRHSSPNPYPLRACMPHAPARLASLTLALFFCSSSIFDSFFPPFFPYGGEPSVNHAAVAKNSHSSRSPHSIPSPRCVQLGHTPLSLSHGLSSTPHHSYTCSTVCTISLGIACTILGFNAVLFY